MTTFRSREVPGTTGGPRGATITIGVILGPEVIEVVASRVAKIIMGTEFSAITATATERAQRDRARRDRLDDDYDEHMTSVVNQK